MTSSPDLQNADLVAVRAEPLPEARRRRLAEVARALGDPSRIEILHLLAVADGPVCVLDFAHHLGLAQSTVSHHLKALVEAGVLGREPRGRWTYYAVEAEVLSDFRHALERLVHFPASLPHAPGSGVE